LDDRIAGFIRHPAVALMALDRHRRHDGRREVALVKRFVNGYGDVIRQG
jgi:hypothetical protein